MSDSWSELQKRVMKDVPSYAGTRKRRRRYQGAGPQGVTPLRPRIQRSSNAKRRGAL